MAVSEKRGGARIKLVFITSVACLLSAGILSGEAAGLVLSDVSVSPESPVWTGDTVTVSAQCETDGVMEDVFVNIKHYYTGSEFRIPMSEEGGMYVSGFDTRSKYLGAYDVLVNCSATEGGNPVTEEEHSYLVVQELSLDIVDSYPEEIFDDNTIDMYVSIVKTHDQEEVVNSLGDVVFSYSVNGGEYVLLQPGQVSFREASGNWVVYLPPMGEAGDAVLAIEATYKDKTVTDDLLEEVLPSKDFHITSVEPAELTGGENVTIILGASYHGSSILDDILDDVSVSLGAREMVFLWGDGEIIFQAPELEPGKYDLAVSVDFRGDLDRDGDEEVIESISEKNVYYVVPISGDMLDAENKVVEGSMEFEMDGWSKIIGFGGGRYSSHLPDGEFDVTVNLPDVLVELTDVEVDGEAEDIIRYDSFGDVELEGLSIASSLALEFGLDFDTASVRMEYNPLNIDEGRIGVFTCNGWNLDSRECSGKWSEIDSVVDIVANTVSFETEHFSAFVIGERESLEIEARINKDVYFLEEEIKVTGVVRSEGVGVVSGARVSYILGEESGVVRTDSDGVFSMTLDAPKVEGIQYLVLEAGKSAYKPEDREIDIKVVKSKDLVWILPMKAQSYDGRKSTFQFSLENSGQENLRDIQIWVSGIPEDWFDYQPKEVRELRRGEEVIVVLEVTPANPEKNAYTINIRAKSGDIEEKDSFGLNINPEAPTGQEEAEPVPITDSITSYFLSIPPDFINVVSIILSVVVILSLSLRLKRKNITRKHISENVMNFMNGIRFEISRGDKKKSGRKGKSRQARTR